MSLVMELRQLAYELAAHDEAVARLDLTTEDPLEYALGWRVTGPWPHQDGPDTRPILHDGRARSLLPLVVGVPQEVGADGC
jgi:hypothetical protein